MKRKIFCANLVRLSEEELLNHIAQWLFTDEKWWDIVGPASCEYKKANSKTEAKSQNQVTCFVNFCILCIYFLLCYLLNIVCFFFVFRLLATKAKKAAFKSVFTSGLAFLGGARLLASPGRRPA